MARRLFVVASFVALAAGLASLALTLYLWFGDWPARTRGLVDHLRSAAENAGRPPEPLIATAGVRPGTSLSGVWQAVIDPYGRAALGGLAPRGLKPEHPSDLGEFSFENGLTLRVPGDWNTQDPRLVFYRGSVWYKTHFDVAVEPGRRLFLWFGAANYRASVYVNGRLIGEHEGGFTPFNFEVTDRVRTGSNLLVVRVDNERSAEDVPTETTDWLNYGGLTRDVRLLSLPETFVRSYRVALDPEREGHVHGWVQLDGPARPTPVRVAIPELDSRVDVVTDDRGRAGFQLDAVPERWSPGSPRLYRVEIEAGDDRVVEEVGFRTVEVQGDEILLNGEPVFLRGISLHEEAPGAGRASGDADAATLLGWARDLSCNFVRLAHYPHDEATSRLADRMGLLVWAEIPVYWDVAFGSEAALERARRQLSELIERDANRASVILWSIGNETPLGDERQRFMTALARYARSADSTRLVTAALLAGPDSLARFFGLYYLPATIGLRRDTWVYRAGDPLGEVVDVPALNQYFGWYYSGAFGLLGPVSSYRARRVMLDNLDRIRLDPGVPKPLIVSELGAGALAGFHAPEGELAAYSEEYQALVYRRQIAMLERQPSLRGVSPWVLKDFRSPLRLYQGVQDYWNRKGLVADDGTRKQAFYVLRDWYRELAERQGSS